MAALFDLKKSDSEYSQIQLSMRDIFEFAYTHGICEGEVQMLIAKEFGPILKLDSSVFSTIKTWFIHNWHRKTQLLEPETHEQVMKSNATEYAAWFNAEEKRHQALPGYIK